MSEKLFRGVLNFKQEDFEAHKELFKELKEGQKPHTFYIGCSDSRIVPNLITKTLPGEIFVVRNIANIENLAVVKAYKNMEDITSALKETGLDNNCVAVSRCGRENEQIIENLDSLEKRAPDYWTLILAAK